jgi:hypothetical protein
MLYLWVLKLVAASRPYSPSVLPNFNVGLSEPLHIQLVTSDRLKLAYTFPATVILIQRVFCCRAYLLHCYFVALR